MTTPAPPSTIYNAVEPWAQQYGVPDAIWEDLAWVESNYMPTEVGDNGTSFGLFQLHIGGQLPSQYYSNPQAVFDPGLNAQIAMPHIASAWNGLKATFDPNSLAWWQNFAAQSGHPGGFPGDPATNHLASIEQAQYNSSISLATNPIDTTGGGGLIDTTGLSDLQSFVSQALKKVGFFLVGLVLAFIGFMLLR